MTGAKTTFTARRLTLRPEAAPEAVDRRFADINGPPPSGCMPGNTASRRIPRKLGLRSGPLEMEGANSRGREVEVQRMILPR